MTDKKIEGYWVETIDWGPSGPDGAHGEPIVTSKVFTTRRAALTFARRQTCETHAYLYHGDVPGEDTDQMFPDLGEAFYPS